MSEAQSADASATSSAPRHVQPRTDLVPALGKSPMDTFKGNLRNYTIKPATFHATVPHTPKLSALRRRLLQPGFEARPTLPVREQSMNSLASTPASTNSQQSAASSTSTSSSARSH